MFTLAKRLVLSALAPSLILLLAAAALAQPRVNGKIAFARGGQIHTMEADGSHITRLTFSGATDDQPTWSPDGTQIAFRSFRDGNARIYVMNSDGSNQHAITNAPQRDARPAWSPDGTRIAFVRTVGNAK